MRAPIRSTFLPSGVCFIPPQPCGRRPLASLIQHTPNDRLSLVVHTRFLKIKQFAVHLIGEAIQAMILAIDKQFDKEAHRAIPTVELGIVGHTRHGIPHIEVHTIAHTDSIDGHGIEHPRLIPSQAKEVGVELFTLTIHHLNGKRFLVITDGCVTPVFHLTRKQRYAIAPHALHWVANLHESRSICGLRHMVDVDHEVNQRQRLLMKLQFQRVITRYGIRLSHNYTETKNTNPKH